MKSIFKSSVIGESQASIVTFKAAVLTTLALTLLNPHVYIDTVLLMGSIATQFVEEQKLLFAAGAIAASFVWFFLLSFGGSLLKPLFQKPLSWKILDGFVCLTMWSIGGSLIL